MTRSRRPARLWLFAVEESSAQVTWSALGPGHVRFEVAGQQRSVELDGGPGSLVLDDLPRGTELELTVHGPGVADGGWRARFRTLRPPPGRELFRFATVSDLHLGEKAFGYFKTIREPSWAGEPYSFRATRQALREALDWGAQLLVVKGDITHSSRSPQWERFGKLIADLDIPVEAIGGNHDSGQYGRDRNRATPGRHRVDANVALARLGLTNAPRYRDVPGLRLVFADTTIPRHHHGTLASVGPQIIQWAGDAERPVGVVLHHHLMRHPVPTFWPPGVPLRESRPFLAQLHDKSPAAFVTSGHTHRHRARTVDGVLVTEVGSPKDFPGTWAGYVVHEGGVRQVVRRVGSADVLAWTDHSARAAWSAWGRWSPGRLADRCVTHSWPGA
jgi:3',5'-cyclic-AMP phosphodiesterase